MRTNKKIFFESAKLRGLHGNVGYVGPWVAWVNFLRGLRGLCGSRYFLRWSIFYVGLDFYVGCVGQIYFCVGPEIFVWVFAWATLFCVGHTFLRGWVTIK